MDLELLSPAGDLQIYKAVVNAGADAVYFGGDMFGARAFAKNFSLEDSIEAIRYGHLHGVKSYLTVNTLLKNTEIERNLYDYLKSYVESGIDAFIVQDIGVFNFIKEFFPKTDIHCSTQMTLCNGYGALLMEQLGASRIVTSRELSLPEIADIRNTCPDLEIEAFVHGALCVCYSGQCLMSSIFGGRSGNRGRCAQPCRLPYNNLKLLGKESLDVKGEYILSPKDFNNIDNLPAMAKAGVNSFKIEGRMKQLPYAVGVVSIYRKYLDHYLDNKEGEYKVCASDHKMLFDYGNRSGFTDLYLNQHNGQSLITFEEPSHSKHTDNITSPSEKKIEIKGKVIAHKGSLFTIIISDDMGHIVSCTFGTELEESHNKPAIEDDILKTVSQTGDTSFEFSDIDVDMEEGLFIPVSTIKNARRNALSEFEQILIGTVKPEYNEFVALKEHKVIEKRKYNIPYVVVNDIAQLKACAEFDFVKRIAVPIKLINDAFKLCQDKDIYCYLPAVFRKDKTMEIALDERLSGYLIPSYDWLGYILNKGYDKNKMILDHRLYTMSNRAIQAFDEMGIFNNCVPYELSLKELAHRNNTYSQFIVYSRIPLMVTANCNINNTIGCNKANLKYSFKDRKGKELLAACDCDNCINTIYNGVIYNCMDMAEDISSLGFKELRLDFTFENEAETKNVLETYKDVFINNKSINLPNNFTKGHLKRGVD